MPLFVKQLRSASVSAAVAAAAWIGSAAARPASAAVEAFYEFNDNGANGATANDTSTFNRDGTLTNFTSTAAGAGDSGTSGWMSSGRLKFDGTDDYVQTTTPTTLLSSTANPSGFTAEMIFAYIGSTNRTWTPILGSSAASATGQIFYVGKRTGNTTSLNVNFEAGLTTANYDPTTGGINLFDGVTRHLAIVYDPSGAQDVIRTYVNGALTHTQNVGGTYSGTSNLRIGGTGHSTTERWTGSIDAVRISSDVLAPARGIL